MNPNELMVSLERQLKPYRGEFPSFPRLPQEGLPRTEVAGLVERLAAAEESRWRTDSPPAPFTTATRSTSPS